MPMYVPGSAACRLPVYRDQSLSEDTFAVIGDLQRTSASERFFCREHNDESQDALIEHLLVHEFGMLKIIGDRVFHLRSARQWVRFDDLLGRSLVPILHTLDHRYTPSEFANERGNVVANAKSRTNMLRDMLVTGVSLVRRFSQRPTPSGNRTDDRSFPPAAPRPSSC